MRHVIRSLVAALVLFAIPAAAQKTATQFYMEYQATWAKAKSIDSLLPFMSKETVSEINASSKEMQQKMFEMLKMMNATNVKVVKETKKGTGWVLDLTGTGSDKKPQTGTAEIVVEGGAMKLKGEEWKM